MSMWRALIACLLVVAPAAHAAEPPSFKKQIVPLFQRQCVACHMTGQEQGQLGLLPQLAYASLVGAASRQAPMARVTPGQPARSYLLHKLRGTHLDQGGSGVRMPMGQEPLADADLALLQAWIDAGAPDN